MVYQNVKAAAMGFVSPKTPLDYIFSTRVEHYAVPANEAVIREIVSLLKQDQSPEIISHNLQNSDSVFSKNPGDLEHLIDYVRALYTQEIGLMISLPKKNSFIMHTDKENRTLEIPLDVFSEPLLAELRDKGFSLYTLNPQQDYVSISLEKNMLQTVMHLASTLKDFFALQLLTLVSEGLSTDNDPQTWVLPKALQKGIGEVSPLDLALNSVESLYKKYGIRLLLDVEATGNQMDYELYSAYMKTYHPALLENNTLNITVNNQALFIPQKSLFSQAARTTEPTTILYQLAIPADLSLPLYGFSQLRSFHVWSTLFSQAKQNKLHIVSATDQNTALYFSRVTENLKALPVFVPQAWLGSTTHSLAAYEVLSGYLHAYVLNSEHFVFSWPASEKNTFIYLHNAFYSNEVELAQKIAGIIILHKETALQLLHNVTLEKNVRLTLEERSSAIFKSNVSDIDKETSSVQFSGDLHIETNKGEVYEISLNTGSHLAVSGTITTHTEYGWDDSVDSVSSEITTVKLSSMALGANKKAFGFSEVNSITQAMQIILNKKTKDFQDNEIIAIDDEAEYITNNLLPPLQRIGYTPAILKIIDTIPTISQEIQACATTKNKLITLDYELSKTNSSIKGNNYIDEILHHIPQAKIIIWTNKDLSKEDYTSLRQKYPYILYIKKPAPNEFAAELFDALSNLADLVLNKRT